MTVPCCKSACGKNKARILSHVRVLAACTTEYKRGDPWIVEGLRRQQHHHDACRLSGPIFRKEGPVSWGI